MLTNVSLHDGSALVLFGYPNNSKLDLQSRAFREGNLCVTSQYNHLILPTLLSIDTCCTIGLEICLKRF